MGKSQRDFGNWDCWWYWQWTDWGYDHGCGWGSVKGKMTGEELLKALRSQDVKVFKNEDKTSIGESNEDPEAKNPREMKGIDLLVNRGHKQYTSDIIRWHEIQNWRLLRRKEGNLFESGSEALEYHLEAPVVWGWWQTRQHLLERIGEGEKKSLSFKKSFKNRYQWMSPTDWIIEL